ncbi:hypothetical protein GA0061096_3024 [Fictibacillus enclensis]|uniref:DUF6254 family protein n=1 Tax=Fictibacillus enclensis TaxID=1017270 RepID=UPI000815E59E|nr:hypothetical protein GA0061096_3024 [Fictibacillus enclensis]
MTHSKARREGEQRAGKETQHPHGKIKSQHELSSEIGMKSNNELTTQPADYDEIEY